MPRACPLTGWALLTQSGWDTRPLRVRCEFERVTAGDDATQAAGSMGKSADAAFRGSAPHMRANESPHHFGH